MVNGEWTVSPLNLSVFSAISVAELQFVQGHSFAGWPRHADAASFAPMMRS
jgi:hypothetical protein